MTEGQRFQFHKGTIKTRLLWRSFPQFIAFQFHKGTIKTGYAENGEEAYKNFNSIKVRLKLESRQGCKNPAS